MFQVKASLSFWPSISMSRRIGTSTSGCVAFSWITAGSWSSKLHKSNTRTSRESVFLPAASSFTRSEIILVSINVISLQSRHCPAWCSPQWEGPLLVTAQPAAVDGGRARHSVQVMRAVGQRGNPLTVPLGLLFPGENTHTQWRENVFKLLWTFLRRPSAKWACVRGAEGTAVLVPEVGGGLGADGDGFVLFIISLKNLLNLRGLQQGHTGSKLSVAMIWTQTKKRAQIQSNWQRNKDKTQNMRIQIHKWGQSQSLLRSNCSVSTELYWPCEDSTIFFRSSTEASFLHNDGYLLYKEPLNIRR